MKIHEKIKMIREKSGLKQPEFAEKFEIKYGTYQTYETGKSEIKLKHIKKIIDEYNINANWLLNDRGEMYLTDTEHENGANADKKEALQALETLRSYLTKNPSP